ncbi:MAG: hypothetical protein N2578_02310 [Bdellovibrionaceae bacterium]|nr:hypothetical protein [Pseudobdellovibrionaceae bacterium]
MLTERSGPSIKRNRHGMAIFEVVPIMIVMALLINYSFGVFGVIQTGIHNNISARNYTFETFSNRTDLTVFRNIGIRENHHYADIGMRAHTINSENAPGRGLELMATERNLTLGSIGAPDSIPRTPNSIGEINTIRPGQKNENVKAAPVWVRTAYGICLNAKCERRR